jgi:hypothetical protein
MAMVMETMQAAPTLMDAQRSMVFRTLIELAVPIQMVMASLMRTDCGTFLKEQMLSVMTQHNQQIKMEMDMETIQLEIIQMHVQPNLAIHGKMQHMGVQTMTEMDGATTKIHIQMTQHNGRMTTVMDLETILVELNQMLVQQRLEIRQKATVMDASIRMAMAGMMSLMNCRT